MKKILFHPITKGLLMLLFCASVVGSTYFGFESIMRIANETELTVYFFDFRFYTPVLVLWTAGCILAVIISFSLLCYGAGRSATDGETRLVMLHRIPYDLMLMLACMLAGVITGFSVEMSYWVYDYNSELAYFLYLGILYVPLMAALSAMLLTSLCARLRAGSWWRNNIITYIVLLCWRALVWCFKRMWRALCVVMKFLLELPSVLGAILFVASVLVLLFFGWGFGSPFLVFFDGVYAITVILLAAVYSRRLERGAERLAKGDLDCHVDTSNMIGHYRKHADHLNHIREGLGEAVEAQLRSERMKTELITNVSHDIKTPLTSIINYVDLMKKEPIESETLKEYLEIMDRQSTRLKKLIEDLIEVSKASTGNITPEMVSTDVGVLLDQVLGEYRERLSAADLTLCANNAATGAQIMADGKLMWRVFDNLLGNVCKYSMPNTRVYLSAAIRGEELEISLRNISLYSLNITSDELMERFVRGDRSRHTEGSGLGLSIAKNLVELQKGKLEIVIDGDLFKAIMHFPLA